MIDGGDKSAIIRMFRVYHNFGSRNALDLVMESGKHGCLDIGGNYSFPITSLPFLITARQGLSPIR